MTASMEEKMQFLGKLLDTTPSVLLPEAEERKDQFLRIVQEKFVPLINQSSLSGMGEYLQDVQRSLDDLLELLTMPELVGNHTIGIVNLAGSEAAASWLAPVLNPYVLGILARNDDLPMVLAAGGNLHLQAINDRRHRMELSRQEFEELQALKGEGVSLVQLLQSYRFALDERWTNTAVSYFPAQAAGDRLLAFQDEIFVLLNDGKAAQLPTVYSDLVPLRLVAPAGYHEALRKSCRKLHALLLTPEQMASRLCMPHQKHKMRFLEMKTQTIFAEMDARYTEAIETQKELLENLKVDRSADIGNVEVEVLMETQQKGRSQQVETLEDEYRQLRMLRPDFVEAAKAVDQALQPEDASATLLNVAARRALYRSLWMYCRSGNQEAMADALKTLQRAKDPLAYVFSLLLQKLQGKHLDATGAKKLREEHETELVRKVKICLGKELDLPGVELQRLARDMDRAHYDTKEEYFYRGLWHRMRERESEGRATGVQQSEAVCWWKLAYQHGSAIAGTRLNEIAMERKDDRLLQWLADHMDAEANYQMGLRAEPTNQSLAEWHYRVAAAQEYVPAVRKILHAFFWRICSAYKQAGFPKGAVSGRLAADMSLAQGLCEFLLRRDPDHPGTDEVMEKYGCLCSWRGDDRKAVRFFQQSGTAEALYRCGEIYQSDDGDVPQNLEEAKRYFQVAAKKGHAQARRAASAVAYQLRKQKKERERTEEQHYQKTADYTAKRTTTRKDDDDDGGCIITTATCHVLHKGDDCEELNTLRRFRDAASEENPIIGVLVKEYYRVAPLLLDEIDALGNKEQVYQQLWETYIVPSYAAAKAQENAVATRIYIEMVVMLCKTYDVPLARGIEEKIHKVMNGTSLPSDEEERKL